MPLGAARFGLLGGIADLGKLELIETQTISSAFADFTSIQESTYNVHLFQLSDVIYNSTANILLLVFKELLTIAQHQLML
jgi:hypothetical protein